MIWILAGTWAQAAQEAEWRGLRREREDWQYLGHVHQILGRRGFEVVECGTARERRDYKHVVAVVKYNEGKFVVARGLLDEWENRKGKKP